MQITADDPIWTQPIQILPMVQAFPELGTLEEFNEKNVVLTEDHKRLFSVVSNKSTIIHHQDAVKMIDEAISLAYGSPPTIEVNSYKSGAQIAARFTLPEEISVNVGENDENIFHVLMHNSYDKALPFKLRAGVYRSICDNGMVLGNDIASVSGKDLLDGWSPEGVSNKLKKMMDNAVNVATLWRQWQDIELSFMEALEAMGNKLPKKFVDMIEQRELEFPMNIWEFYNILTAISTHESASDRAKTSFEGTISNIFYSRKQPLYKVYSSVLAEQIPELVTG